MGDNSFSLFVCLYLFVYFKKLQLGYFVFSAARCVNLNPIGYRVAFLRACAQRPRCHKPRASSSQNTYVGVPYLLSRTVPISQHALGQSGNKSALGLTLVKPVVVSCVGISILSGTNSRKTFFVVPRQVVHFGGYLLGKAHSQRVRVVNVSRTSQHLHILGPSTGCFRVRVTDIGKEKNRTSLIKNIRYISMVENAFHFSMRLVCR